MGGRFSSGEFGGELNHEQMGLAEFIQEVTIVSRHLIVSFARHHLQDGCVSVHELAIVTEKCLSSHHDVRKVLPSLTFFLLLLLGDARRLS